MRILQIHNLYALPGGEDVIADAEAQILEDAGHEVQRVRSRNPAGGAGALAAVAGAAWNPVQGRAVHRRARAWRPDIAHVHNTWFALSPVIFHALRDARVPIVMTLQNYRLLCANAQLFRDGATCTECVGSHPWHGVRHRCYRESAAQSAVAAATISLARRRRSFDLVDRFIAPSRFVRSVFVDAGMPEDRVVVKRNVVADPGPRPAPPSASGTLLYAGRLHPEKGVDVLLDAWRRVEPLVPGLELVVVGDGPLRGQLERGAAARVRFTGWLSARELGDLLLRSRALLFPSQWLENFGRVIAEAMAAGLPVLASDLGTPGEIVRELGPEWVVHPAGDPQAWAPAIARLADPGPVDSASGRARRLFEEQYSSADGLRRLTEIYEAVLTDAKAAR